MPLADRQLFKNAMLTAIQVLVSAVSMFVIYKYLLNTIGPAQFGVWSIVMAVSTVARITDMGFAGGMTRFVAKYTALGDEAGVIEVVETGTLSLCVMAIVVLAVAYPALHWGLPRFLSEGGQDAVMLLPFSLLSLGILTVAGGYLSSLDGFLRADLRSLIVIGGMLFYVLLVFVFVSQMGFVGLGWAQLAQSSFVFVGAALVVHRQLGSSWLPLRWSRSRFREMISYNMHLQLGTLASLLGDPVAKLLLGRYGDLATVGYFEMATKLVSQFRAVVVNVNQVFVPVIARLKEGRSNEIANLYDKTYAVIFYVSTTFFGALLAVMPAVSELWLGHYNGAFILVGLVMLPSMFINTLAGAAFFSNMGVGDASRNSRVQVVMGLTNLVLGFGLGWWFGWVGVVVAYGVSITLGSLYLILSYRSAEGFSSGALLPAGMRRHFGITLLISMLSLMLGHYARNGAVPGHWWFMVAALAVILVSALRCDMFTLAWRHLSRRNGGAVP